MPDDGALPPHAHWVGAFRPDPPAGWTPPPWWGEVTARDRPVVHVSQGTIRPDVTELIVPALRGLADLDALEAYLEKLRPQLTQSSPPWSW